MRGISNLEKLKEYDKIKEIIDFVKAKENKDDVFLGIRENEIHLYVNTGGRFLAFKVNGRKTNINRKTLTELKQSVIHRKKNNPEKDFKQKIINAINTNSDFYAYDIEYRFKSKDNELQELVLPKNEKFPQADLMLISKPNKNNEICIYMIEIKYGNKNFNGASKDEVGSGIVGHVGNFVRLVRWTRNDCKVNISGEKKKYVRENMREQFLNEVKSTMNFYKKFGLIRNKKFLDVCFDKIKLKDSDEAIQFGFILGDCNKSIEKSFKHYLGVDESGNSKYSVKRLLKNEVPRNYEYITLDEMLDFKYITYSKEDEENIKFNANYNMIRKEFFK